MKQLLFLKTILTRGCVFYTFLITAVYLLGATVNSAWIPTPQMVLGLLVFSFVLAGANTFLFSDCLVFPLRLLLHFVATTLVFYLLFVKLGGYEGSVVTVLLVYAFVYGLSAVLVGVYRYLTAELRAEKKHESLFAEERYESQFGGEKK